MTRTKPDSRWQAANGTPLHLRPVRADDGERLRRSLDKLSPEARRQRFLAPINHIGDAWQGQGIGARLLRALIREAERRGLRSMVGHILLDNRPMLALARHHGFGIEESPDDTATRIATLTLPRRKPRQGNGIVERFARLLGRRPIR